MYKVQKIWIYIGGAACGGVRELVVLSRPRDFVVVVLFVVVSDTINQAGNGEVVVVCSTVVVAPLSKQSSRGLWGFVVVVLFVVVSDTTNQAGSGGRRGNKRGSGHGTHARMAAGERRR
jgi:hypothetical protein